MPNRITGNLSGSGLHIGIVCSRFNSEVTEGLLQGATKALIESGVKDSDITVVEVPGAFEIPFALSLLAEKKTFDSLIALGAVINGETAHFEYISKSAFEGIGNVSQKFSLPIACGVLTTYTDEQAIARSSDNIENKGREAAQSAVEMANLRKKLS